MHRHDDHISALLAADPVVAKARLIDEIEIRGESFPSLVIEQGLGPMWYQRTGREEFKDSRITAEALFVVQEQALHEIDEVLTAAGITYVVFKGAANRLHLYDEPAIRACYDVDLLVHPRDRTEAVLALKEVGYEARIDASTISHQLVLNRRDVDIDLHWGLLREGRLRRDEVSGMLDRRTRSLNVWMLSSDDALFVLLVHPAFAKHLASYGMGMHRIADLWGWITSQPFDWPIVLERLENNGVKAAAWATLRWLEMTIHPSRCDRVASMMADLEPGALRRTWIGQWLRNDWPQRTSGRHGLRLVGFSPFLHDSFADVARTASGRLRAYRRRDADRSNFDALETPPS